MLVNKEVEMAEYLVEFVVTEFRFVRVDASSEREAHEKVKLGDYDDVRGDKIISSVLITKAELDE